MIDHEWTILDPGPTQEWTAPTVAPGHGARIRRRRIANQMLWRLETIVTTPYMRWLWLVRLALCLAAVWCYAGNWRMDALILLVAVAVVQLMITEQLIVGLVRREGEQ